MRNLLKRKPSLASAVHRELCAAKAADFPLHYTIFDHLQHLPEKAKVELYAGDVVAVVGELDRRLEDMHRRCGQALRDLHVRRGPSPAAPSPRLALSTFVLAAAYRLRFPRAACPPGSFWVLPGPFCIVGNCAPRCISSYETEKVVAGGNR